MKTLTLSDELYAELVEIANNVSTQDNVGTAAPIYHVIKQPVAQYVSDANDARGETELVFQYDCDIYDREALYQLYEDDELEDALIKANWDKDDIDDAGLEQLIADLGDWEFIEFIQKLCREATPLYRWYKDQEYTLCGTFLTRAHAELFMKQNAHHLHRDAYIYVKHAWRNFDAKAIQDLMEAIVEQTLEQVEAA